MTIQDVYSRQRQRLANTRAISQPRFFQDPKLVGADSHYHGVSLIATMCKSRVCYLGALLSDRLALLPFAVLRFDSLPQRPEEMALKDSGTSREMPLSKQRRTPCLGPPQHGVLKVAAEPQGASFCLQSRDLPSQGSKMGRCKLPPPPPPPPGPALTHHPGN